jgi:tetratricopeptide (TPR) repeat protein
LIAKGAFAEAEKAIAEAERLALKLEDTTVSARIQVVRARLDRGLGHLTEAVTHYKEAIASFEALAMRADLAHACNELGEVLIESERPSEAAPYLARALQELKTDRTPGRTAGQA